MKFRTRFKIFLPLAGLTLLIANCNTAKSELEYISSKQLPDFPSASAIEYYDGRFYILGDDAPYLLVLDREYNMIDTVHYVDDTSARLEKDVKPDIESAAILTYLDKKYLYAPGSMSTEARMRLHYFPLGNIHSNLSLDLTSFAEKLNQINDLNIEGFAIVKSKFVLSSRANTTHRTNRIIISGTENANINEDVSVSELILDSNAAIGISGLYYLEEKDILLFTASEEDTPDAIQDGVIKDSYVGWIRDFSLHMNERQLKPYQFIKLSDINPVFVKQKVESVCVEEVNGQELIIHLVADNDDGRSMLFKMRVRM